MEQQREGFIELENGSLHYQRWGSGGRVLLAFHGYGNTAALFSSFGTHLGQEFTILSFDLPHHGKSQWPPDNLVHKADLQKLVSAVRHTYGVNKVSLAGYSMGGAGLPDPYGTHAGVHRSGAADCPGRSRI